MTPASILFVTWDGPQVSYLESLFLPIFMGLAKRGHQFHVLQFTWADKRRRDAVQALCEAAGCSYRSAPVLRKTVAAGSLVSAVLGSRHVRRAIAQHNIDIVMPRSTLPAFSSMLAMRHFASVSLLFDADGLPHDERVDFGGWSAHGLAYRMLRDMEATAVRRADGVLTRSRKAIEILVARAGAGTSAGKFHVVANGRDAGLFSPASAAQRASVRRELGIADSAPLLVYAGSMGNQYCMPEMLELFKRVRDRRSDAQFLLLTGSPQEVERRLEDAADLRSSCHVLSVPPDAVPRYLGACDLGLALRRPSFSMQAVAPIKLGEYLLCGLPVVATRAIGDTDEQISAQVGYSLTAMSTQELGAAADWFVDVVLADGDGFAARCRETGLRHFSLAASVDAYSRAIESIAVAS
ncbi:MAG: glycosyltransferase [Luteimonas sp.]